VERRKLIKTSPLSHLEAPSRPVSREHVLAPSELGKVLAKATREPSTFARIVELLIRTGQRVKQIAHLRAEWIDTEKRLITWPREIMKAKREHAIPFTDTVAVIFENLPKHGLLFPAKGREAPFSGFSKAKAAFDKDLGVTAYTLHDFRRNFSSECAALAIDPLTVERILAHSIPGVAGIYNRYSYLQPMRAAMLAYERYLQRLLAA
jgi:integrase